MNKNTEKCGCFSFNRDTVPAKDRRTWKNYFFPNNEMRVINKSDYEVYAIISPTANFKLSELNIQRLGGVKFENNGVTIRSQGSGIKSDDNWILTVETKKVYITVFVRTEHGWIQWKKNIYVNTRRDDFMIKRGIEPHGHRFYTDVEFDQLLGN
jgi:hypothetical protein